MALNFPTNPGVQTPPNIFSPTSTPNSTSNGLTYLWDGEKWMVQSSSGGSSTTINYNGASAWGSVGSSGGLRNSLNVASVTYVSEGTYDVVFTTPMPDIDYSIVVTAKGSSSRSMRTNSVSATGFRVLARDLDNVNADTAFTFAVHASNALPPQGGTGADAWIFMEFDGNARSSFNLSGTSPSFGRYVYTFGTPMPTNDYAVVAQIAGDADRNRFLTVQNQTTTGFEVTCVLEDGSTRQNQRHSVVVHATNAQLPDTITTNELVFRDGRNSVTDSLTFEDDIKVTGTWATGSGPGSNSISRITGDICGIDMGTSSEVGEKDLGRIRYDTRDHTMIFASDRNTKFSINPTGAVVNGTLTNNGDAAFTGRLTASSDLRVPSADANSGANVGCRLSSSGLVISTTATQGGEVFRGYVVGSNVKTSSIIGIGTFKSVLRCVQDTGSAFCFNATFNSTQPGNVTTRGAGYYSNISSSSSGFASSFACYHAGNATAFFGGEVSVTGYLRSTGAYNDVASSGGGANVRIASNGRLQRYTSSRRYKTNVRDFAVPGNTTASDFVKNLKVRAWEDYNSNQTAYGFVAEEVYELGGENYVSFAPWSRSKEITTTDEAGVDTTTTTLITPFVGNGQAPVTRDGGQLTENSEVVDSIQDMSIIATLTKALQEALTRIEALEAAQP